MTPSVSSRTRPLCPTSISGSPVPKSNGSSARQRVPELRGLLVLGVWSLVTTRSGERGVDDDGKAQSGRRGVLIVALMSGTIGITPALAASRATPGVTKTTIRVGIPYVNVDVAVLRDVGVNLNFGNVPDAFEAIIDDINAHGGINGRKIVPYLVAVNPVGTAPTATAYAADRGRRRLCGHRAARGHLLPRARHPRRRLDLRRGPSSSGAQDFTFTPPYSAYDPLQLSVYDKQGVFKHEKVALFGGDTEDRSELALVQSALAKLHVRVVTTAVDSAPQGECSRGQRPDRAHRATLRVRRGQRGRRRR